MPLIATIVFAPVAVVWALYKGTKKASNSRLILAWASGVAALHYAATIILWADRTNWNDPHAPSRLGLGSLLAPIIATTALALTVAYTLWLRQSTILYLALVALPFMVWYWLPAFS